MKNAAEKGKLSVGERLRKTCEELGPTFVKLGQILSTRTDIVSQDIAMELAKLQDSAAPFPFELAREVIETEFCDKLEHIFPEFDPTPVAAASMSQVYRARLNSGQTVAVKVRRPDIDQSIAMDTRVLKSIARFVDKYTRYGELYEFEGMVDEFVAVMLKELDFTIEADNAERIAKNAQHYPGIATPKIHWIYTSRRVLTMEYIEGIRIGDVRALKKAGIDTKKVGNNFVNCLLMQILKDGFFQADPHPGNEIIRPNGELVMIDLGMAGVLSEHFRSLLSYMLVGMSVKNTRRVAESVLDMGIVQEHVNEKAFEREIGKLLERFMYGPLDTVNIVEVFTGIFEVASRFRIKIPREFTMVAKCLGTVQKIIEQLAPELSMLEIANHVAKRIFKDKLSAHELAHDALSQAVDWGDLTREVPVALHRFLRKAEETDFVLELKINEIDKMEKRMEQVFNRIAWAVVLLAVSIVMAGVVIALGTYFSGRQDDSLVDLGLLAIVVGATIAGIIVAGLLISIITSARSGRRK